MVYPMRWRPKVRETSFGGVGRTPLPDGDAHGARGNRTSSLPGHQPAPPAAKPRCVLHLRLVQLLDPPPAPQRPLVLLPLNHPPLVGVVVLAVDRAALEAAGEGLDKVEARLALRRAVAARVAVRRRQDGACRDPLGDLLDAVQACTLRSGELPLLARRRAGGRPTAGGGADVRVALAVATTPTLGLGLAGGAGARGQRWDVGLGLGIGDGDGGVRDLRRRWGSLQRARDGLQRGGHPGAAGVGTRG